LVTVTERWPLVDTAAQAEMGAKDPIGNYEALVQKGAQSTLAAAAVVASEIGIGIEQVHVRDQHPAIRILAAAEKEKPDLIVMASHGRRGLNKMLLDSVANEVVSGSTIPVLVVK
jgi:nucleotide-binding universal stress UspA family protein